MQSTWINTLLYYNDCMDDGDLKRDESLVIPLFMFLTIENCPPSWKDYDLYIIRDDTTVFYVGQSHCAFSRVWDHLLGGIHGHAVVGRFIIVNWPKSGRFTIELLSSRSARFSNLAQNLSEAERSLIEDYCPCFNISLNGHPTPLPAIYLPPNARIKTIKSFKRMLREAAYGFKRLEAQDIHWD